MDQFLGQVLCDRYQIQSLLGRQTGRRTFLATDLETQSMVVVKLLLFNPDFTWDDLKLFEREADTLKSLSHSAIPKYLDSFEVGTELGRGFALVQSYINAQSLQEWIQSGRTFSEAELKTIARDLLEILDYLHNRQPSVVHRDIKPSNILLGDRSGNSPGSVYLVDFGSVQTIAQGGTVTVVGTYGYMPPEQSGGRTTPVSDLYSLGATLMYLVTGQHPADLTTDDLQLELGQFTMLSPELTRWLRRMVQRVPSKRFVNASEALQALQHPPLDDLRLPETQLVGSQILIKHHHDHLSIQLPQSYVVSSDPFSRLLSTSAGLAGLVLFGMIFTVSSWHFFSLLLFLCLCEAISKSRSCKILIDDEKILFQSFFLSFIFRNWSYERRDIHRLHTGKLPLASWMKSSISPENRVYQVTIHIGTIPCVIQTKNEVEILWLSHELSKYLNLPLTSSVAHQTTDISVGLEEVFDSVQASQLPTQKFMDPALTTVNKPANSKIKLENNNSILRIRLPRQNNSDFILFLFFIMVIPGIALVLMRFFSWICFWIFGWMNEAELHEVIITQFSISFKFKLYGLNIDRSFSRAQISHLEVIEAYYRPGFEGEPSIVRNWAGITIWIGILPFKISNLSDAEESWLSYELSEVLNVPVKRTLFKK